MAGFEATEAMSVVPAGIILHAYQQAPHLTSWTSLPLLAMAAWLVWRLWRFSVQPWLNPSEPKELPYLVPGHGPALFKNADKLFTSARLFFSDDRKPFAIEAGGTRIYILTDPRDVAETYKNSETLSIDMFFQQMIRACGASELCARRMFQSPREFGRNELFANPKHKSVARLSHDLHRRQLTGAELDGIVTRFVERFAEALNNPEVMASRPEKDGPVVALYPWMARVFTEAGQSAYFGKQLGLVANNHFDTFLRFDHLSWQFLYRLPSFMCGEVHTAMAKLVDGLHEYFEIPPEDRDDGVWFTQAYEQELRASGLSSRDVAVIYMLIYWGLNTNIHKACFWLMCYLIRDPALVAVIREESQPAFVNGTVDHRYLAASCPRLVAAYNESLRLSAASQSVRFITDDTTVGDHTLRKGNQIIIPLRQMHVDEAVWGGQIDKFDPERFLRDEKLEKSTSWRPFGGGVTQCPGRHLAKHAAISFAAMMLRRYDVRFVEGQTVPRMDLTRPWLGVVAKREDDPETLVVIRERLGHH